MKARLIKDNRAEQTLQEFGQLAIGATMTAITDRGDAQAFVQRLRVRMSRVRDKIKLAKLNPAQFTMKFVSTKIIKLKDPESGIEFEMDEVTIKKTENRTTDMEDVMAKIAPFKGMVAKARGVV